MFKKKRMRLLAPLLMVILALLQANCHGFREEGRGSYLFDCEQAEQDALTIYKVIRPGATYRTVHRRIPGLGELTPEGGSELQAAPGLSEATALTELFDRETVLEFNFKDGRLYSYYFFLREFDQIMADRLYHRIKAFYLSGLGHGAEEEEQDGDRLKKSVYWIAHDLEVVVTINTTSEASVMSWGFQQPGLNTADISNNQENGGGSKGD